MVPERYNASALLFHNVEAGRADRVAITCGSERITYGELARRVNRCGSALRSLGIQREQRVLLVLNDTPAFPAAFFGAIRIGAVPVPVNTYLKPDDYRFFVEDSYAPLVIVDVEHYPKVKEGLRAARGRARMVVANGRVDGEQALEDLLAAGEDDLAPADTHRDDPAFWLYSSGSTGRPKAVVHLQHDMLVTCETYARHVLEIGPADVTFSAAKLFHAYGLGNNMSFPYWAGAATVLYPGKPTPRAVFETIQRCRPTLFFGVPTLYNAMLNDPEAARWDMSSLRLCLSAAEPLPRELWLRWKETYGLVILDGIGSTEMLHIFMSNTRTALKPGSTGRPVPGYDVKILDDEGQPVEPGQAGNLWVRGDSAAEFYWHNHEKTKATIVGEWVYTGDRYRVDEDGFYWFEGRCDDMLKVGGLWVSPIDIENALMEHPAVMEAAVVGVPVEGLTRVKAFVTLRSGYSPSDGLAADLQAWCKDRLQRYQYPHVIEFVDELPKTVTGKIQRFKLREPA